MLCGKLDISGDVMSGTTVKYPGERSLIATSASVCREAFPHRPDRRCPARRLRWAGLRGYGQSLRRETPDPRRCLERGAAITQRLDNCQIGFVELIFMTFRWVGDLRKPGCTPRTSTLFARTFLSRIVLFIFYSTEIPPFSFVNDIFFTDNPTGRFSRKNREKRL